MPSGLRGEGDVWFKSYEETKQLAADILGIIQERNTKFPNGGQDASRLTALARRKLGTLGSSVEALRDILESAECSGVTEVEKNVRRDMISTLKSSREQMLHTVRRDAQAQTRFTLLEPSAGVSNAQRPQETVRTAELDNRGILQMQRQMMQEQDTELAELEKTVNSTKHIALTINEELGLQERLLDELDEDVDVSHSRLKAAQKKLTTVMRSSGQCKSTLLTIGLMFVLMIVIVVCFKLGSWL